MNDRTDTRRVTAALAFLIGRTVRNRIVAQFKRVKTPRYAVALLFGVAYLWLVFLRPGGVGAASGNAIAPVSTTLGTVAGFGLTVAIIFWWLRGGVQGSLAFQPAEVQFLFTAPVTRRALLAYKILRSQLLIVINAVIWAFLIRRWGVSLPGPERFATAWGFFTVLSLHRLGTALVQLPPLRGPRKAILIAAKLLAASAFAAIVIGALPVLRQLGSSDYSDSFAAFRRTLELPPLRYVLLPMRLVIAPIMASTSEQWAKAFAIVIGIIAVHVVWVFSMRVPFEEAATVASAEMAKRIAAFKNRRGGGSAAIVTVKVKRDWLPLAPLGRPAVAITWKNTLALTRAGSLQSAVVLVVLLAVITRLISATSHGTAGAELALPYLILAAFALFMGPRAVRNDLRQDLPNLPLLKTFPLSGAVLVLAEMASPTLVLAVFQGLMLVVAYFVAPATLRDKWDTATTVVVFVLVPLGLLAVNAVSIGIQNGAAVLFPGWVRLGPDAGGLEAMGQNLLLTFGSMFALLLALIVPMGVTVGATFLNGPAHGAPAIAVAGVIAIAVLIGEIWWLITALGRVFERMDPAALT